ncbi:hypothetical protein Ancab_012657 [Ancistrocladus abbreviatus]
MQERITENRKIHPVFDQEAPPTIPLVPRPSPRSERGNADLNHPPLDTSHHAGRTAFNPAHTRAPLVIHPKPPNKRSGCCCRCVCWTLGLLLFLLIIIGVAALVIYLVFHPKIPNYSIDQLRITDLRLNLDMSLYAKFNVSITAYNPNKKVGIYYEKGGEIIVWYGSTELCKGTVPPFYQGHLSRKVINVDLTGQNEYGSALMAALQQQQQTGNIPLNLKVNMPVAIKLGS